MLGVRLDPRYRRAETYNRDGSFAGYIGSCVDVTDRKLAEEALSSVSCRLIEAQEKEPTRIARELHDDINQQLARARAGEDGLGQRTRLATAPGVAATEAVEAC